MTMVMVYQQSLTSSKFETANSGWRTLHLRANSSTMQSMPFLPLSMAVTLIRAPCGAHGWGWGSTPLVPQPREVTVNICSSRSLFLCDLFDLSLSLSLWPLTCKKAVVRPVSVTWWSQGPWESLAESKYSITIDHTNKRNHFSSWMINPKVLIICRVLLDPLHSTTTAFSSFPS